MPKVYATVIKITKKYLEVEVPSDFSVNDILEESACGNLLDLGEPVDVSQEEELKSYTIVEGIE